MVALIIEETTNQAESQRIKSNVGFFGDWGKPEYQGKTSQNRVEYQQPQSSIHIRQQVNKSNLGHIGGRRVLSPLRQTCSLVEFILAFNNNACFFYQLVKVCRSKWCPLVSWDKSSFGWKSRH